MVQGQLADFLGRVPAYAVWFDHVPANLLLFLRIQLFLRLDFDSFLPAGSFLGYFLRSLARVEYLLAVRRRFLRLLLPRKHAAFVPATRLRCQGKKQETA